MPVFEEEVAAGGHAPLTRMIGGLGLTAVLGQDPFDPGIEEIGRMGTMTLEAIDEDRGRRKLTPQFLAVVPVTQSIRVVIPSTVHAAGKEEIPDEDA